MAREKQTHGLRVTGLLFELHWAAIGECLMQPLAVVKDLDLLRNGVTGFHIMLKAVVPYQLVLQ